MTTTRADIALALARALITDRARWPAAPLIGAGANWLRPGAIAEMADGNAVTDDVAGAVRATTAPFGLLDALETADQYSAHIEGMAEALRRDGAPEAANDLRAERFGPDADATIAGEWGQFRDYARKRIERERPAPPPWLAPRTPDGEPWTPVSAAAAFALPDEQLDELAPGELEIRLERIEAAREGIAARLAWLRDYGYPAAPAGFYDEDPPGIGMIDNDQAVAGVLSQAWNAADKAWRRQPLEFSDDAAFLTERQFRRLAVDQPARAMFFMHERRPRIPILPRFPAGGA